MSIEHDLNRELEKDFPPQTLNRPLRIDGHAAPQKAATGALQRAEAIPQLPQALRPLARLAEALDRIDQLAAAVEKAEADAAKLLAAVRGKL
jgi:hypothetical protein